MDIAWMSSFDQGIQRFEAVSSDSPGARPAAGEQMPLESSFCVRVLDGRLDPLVPNTLVDPETRDLEVTSELGLAAYAGAPVRRPDGSVRGMLCCVNRQPRSDLTRRDLALLELLAAVLAEVVDREADDDGERRDRRDRLMSAIRGEGRETAYQPLIEARTGRAIGVEALSRFPGSDASPAQWFAQAAAAGLLAELESAAACTAMQVLDEQPDVLLAVNLSPATVTSGMLDDLLLGVDVSRLTIELTEHAPVEDYDELLARLAPHRARGLQIAVDDAGAGYASFRHILNLAPDLIKIDMSLVRDVDRNLVKQTLVSSLLTCARAAGAELLAEGVEREEELRTLVDLGVSYVQGFLCARPAPVAVPVGAEVFAQVASV